MKLKMYYIILIIYNIYKYLFLKNKKPKNPQNKK